MKYSALVSGSHPQGTTVQHKQQRRAGLREPPWGADGQTARAMLRSKQAPRVGGGQYKIYGEAADKNNARSA